jgi:hypothetical protein
MGSIIVWNVCSLGAEKRKDVWGILVESLGIDYHDECEWASGACATWKFNAAILEDLTTKMTWVHNTE